jgi:hypothetical protein
MISGTRIDRALDRKVRGSAFVRWLPHERRMLELLWTQVLDVADRATCNGHEADDEHDRYN